MYKYIKDCYLKSGGQKLKISQELWDIYKIDSSVIINDFLDCMYLSENKSYYIYQIDTNFKYRSGYKYYKLFNFLDNGTASNRGLNLIIKLKVFLNNNLQELFNLYIYEKLTGGNSICQ